jgi:hypothetical protein
MSNAGHNVWTQTAYLVIDAVDERHEQEASRLRVGVARLSWSRLHVELLPGLAVSGRLVFELQEGDG